MPQLPFTASPLQVWQSTAKEGRQEAKKTREEIEDTEIVTLPWLVE